MNLPTTATLTARGQLYTAITMAMPAELQLDDRVHRHQPADLATPAVWLGVAERRPDVGGVAVIVTIPVWVVVDGADAAQVDLLDVLGDVVWDAAASVGMAATRAVPGVLDVGGPRLRNAVVDVDVVVPIDTLCPSSLVYQEA